MVDKYPYHVGRTYAGQPIALHLDAKQQCFHVQHRGQRVKQLKLKGLLGGMMAFQDYLVLMMKEARSIERHLMAKARRA